MHRQQTKNPHKVPLDRIVWHTGGSHWEFPLKAVIGESDRLMAKDGRRFVMIAELYAPTKCTYHSHPDNFLPIVDTAKRIILGELTSYEQLEAELNGPQEV